MSSYRIVLADDVAYFRTLLRLALGDPFEIVAEAGDGREAVEAVGRERPDAIVLDLSMPVMDGMQAIPEIRRASPSTKILVLSGFETSAVGEKAVEIGADAYLEKGVNVDEIADALIALLGAPGAG